MEVLEIEEFSTFENIKKFLNNVNMPAFISRYFDSEPLYTAAVAEVGGTVLTFQSHPLEIGISGTTAEISIFVNFRVKREKQIKILKFVDKDTIYSEVIQRFGVPDFEIDEQKRRKLNHDAKMVKYFIDDKYSISFDYNKRIELVSIFHDKYR